MPQIERWHSQDIDEQSGSLDGWEQRYRQLSCGKFTGSVLTARGQRMSVVSETANQSLHQSVVAPAGELVFGMVLNRDDALQVNRRQASTSSLLVMEGGKEYDFCTSGSTHLLGFAVQRDVFFNSGMARNIASLELAISQGVVQLEQSAAIMLRSLALMMSKILHCEESTWPSSMPWSVLAETTLSNIALALRMSLENSGVTQPKASDRQARAVRKAIHFMSEHLMENITMADICGAAHVSQRTLQYHFENWLHISPQQYLKAMRLNLARRMLRKLGAESMDKRRNNIAEIAAACGFEHPSRFAGDFKRQFGALPSETLRDALQHGLAVGTLN